VTVDPFTRQENEEDEIRAKCVCGWTGPWREWIREAYADERDHRCYFARNWRPAPDPSPEEQAVIDRFGIFAEDES
jgi:glycerol-3-phosphate dehydrogenase